MKGIFTITCFILFYGALAQTPGIGQQTKSSQTQTTSALSGSTANWSNPTFTATSDGTQFASATWSRRGQSNYLRLSNFGLTIPTNYTVSGIAVTIKDRNTGGTTAFVGTISLVDASGSITSYQKAITAPALSSPFTDRTFGASGDLWGSGTTFTSPSVVNDPNFGIAIEAHRDDNGNQTSTYEIDYVTITIYYTNPVPNATPNSYNAAGNLTPVTGNVMTDGTPDSDPNGEAITAQVSQAPSTGTLVLNANGSFTYTPPATNFPGGPITFQYTVTDNGTPASTSAPATVTITYPQPAPTAVDDLFPTGSVNNSISGNVLTNDSDPQGQTLTSAVASPPAVGSLVLQTNGNFTYTPPTPFSGGDVTFVYRVTDNGNPAKSSTATVTLSYPAQALPVEFISLEANKAFKGVQLTWQVGTEINVVHYEVERSTDGNNYKKIGTVAATQNNIYSFTDLQPVNGLAYYRVRNVDLDGAFKYTTVVKYKNESSVSLYKAFPTTTSTQVTLQHPSVTGKAIITLSSLEGKALRSTTPTQGSVSTQIDLSAYPSGMYLLQYLGENGRSESFRVFKQ